MDRARQFAILFSNRARSRDFLAIALVLAVAFTLRLAAAFALPIDYRFERDAVEYVSDAHHLLTLGVFGEEPGVPYAIIPPGYPLFIAGIFMLTNQSMIAVRLAQVALATLMVWLTFLVGKEIASKRAALLGAFIIAVYPVWIFWPIFFLTETLYTVLLLIFTWCLVRSAKTCTVKYAVVTGAAFGLALLTREVLFLFPLLLPVVFWAARTPWQQALHYLFVFTLVTLLVLSPWLIRNYHTFGQVFYTERTEAIRYQLTGSGYLSPHYRYLVDDSASPPYSKPPEYFERYGQPSEMLRINRLFTEPRRYLYHIVNRVIELWLHPNGLASVPDILIVRVVYIALHIGTLGLAAMSIVIGLERRAETIIILSLLLLYTTGTNLFLTVPQPRYTLPSLPLVFILAAMGLNVFWQRLQRGRAIKVTRLP